MASFATSYVAGKVASQKAEGLLAPLLEAADDDGSTASESTFNSKKSDIETVKLSPMQKLKSTAILLIFAAGVAASVVAMIISPAVVVFVMGGVCIGNVPHSAFKEMQLGKLPTLRSMNNRLKESANLLEEEVDMLSEEIDLLKPEADRATAVEEQLQKIAEEQNINVNQLVALVKENESILIKMRDNLRQRIVQDVITIVVKSDRNNDQAIDRVEAKILALQIRLALQEYGVEFDSEKFMLAIRQNPSVSGVMAIAQRLLKGDTGDQSNVPEDDDDLYDMFYTSDEVTEKVTQEPTGRRVSLVARRSSICGKFHVGASDMGSIIRMSEKCVLKGRLMDG